MDNRDINGFNLFKDHLPLLNPGKRLLANHFFDNLNDFLLVMH